MASPIWNICAQVATIIEASTPKDEAQFVYREHRGAEPLEREKPPPSAVDTNRVFEVRPSPDVSAGAFGGPSPEVRHRFEVLVRYQVGGWLEDGWKRVSRMAASDASIIRAALIQPPASTGWGSVAGCHPENIRAEDFSESPHNAGVWLLRLSADILYTETQ